MKSRQWVQGCHNEISMVWGDHTPILLLAVGHFHMDGIYIPGSIMRKQVVSKGRVDYMLLGIWRLPLCKGKAYLGHYSAVRWKQGKKVICRIWSVFKQQLGHRIWKLSGKERLLKIPSLKTFKAKGNVSFDLVILHLLIESQKEYSNALERC